MDWIEEILKKHINAETGALDLESATEEINRNASKHVVPVADYNTVVKDKKAAEKKVTEYEDEKLTDAEKQQRIIDDAVAEKEKYLKLSNRIEVEKIFLGVGMVEDDYKDFIDGVVTSDVEASKNIATAMANTFKAKISAAEVQAKNDQLKNTPRPGGGDGVDGKGKTKQQIFAEELANEGSESLNTSKSVLEYYGGK